MRCKNENWHLQVPGWYMVPPSTLGACSAATSPRARAKLAWYYRDLPGYVWSSSRFLHHLDTVFRQTGRNHPFFGGNALIEGTYGTLGFYPRPGGLWSWLGFNVSIFKTNVWKIHVKNHPAFLENVHLLVWKIIYIKMKHCKNPW